MSHAPPEVMHAIFAEASVCFATEPAEPYGTSRRNAELSAYAQVCKAWQGPAYDHLYGDLVINNWTPSVVGLLNRSFDDNPALSQLVRSFKAVYLPLRSLVRNEARLLGATGELDTMRTTIRQTLRNTGSFGDYADFEYNFGRIFNAHVDQESLRRVQKSGDGKFAEDQLYQLATRALFDFVTRLSGLLQLHIRNFNQVVLPEDPLMIQDSLARALKTVTRLHVSGVVNSIVGLLLAATPHLSSFVLEEQSVPLQDATRPSFLEVAPLRRLRLGLAVSTPRIDPDMGLVSAMTFVNTIATLESLEITGRMRLDFIAIVMGNLGRVLPLRYFRLDATQLSPKEVVAISRFLECSPSLEHLRIGHHKVLKEIAASITPSLTTLELTVDDFKDVELILPQVARLSALKVLRLGFLSADSYGLTPSPPFAPVPACPTRICKLVESAGLEMVTRNSWSSTSSRQPSQAQANGDLKLKLVNQLATDLAQLHHVGDEAEQLVAILKAALKSPNAHLQFAGLSCLPLLFPLIAAAASPSPASAGSSAASAHAHAPVAHQSHVLKSALTQLAPFHRLADSKAQVREVAREACVQAARAALRLNGGLKESAASKDKEGPWAFVSRNMVEMGFASKNAKAKEQALHYLVALRTSSSPPHPPLRPFTPLLLPLLSDPDSAVRALALQSVIAVFSAPEVTAPARADLKKALATSGVNKKVEEAILTAVLGGGGANSMERTPSDGSLVGSVSDVGSLRGSSDAGSISPTPPVPASIRPRALPGRPTSSVPSEHSTLGSLPAAAFPSDPASIPGQTEISPVYIASDRDLASEFEGMRAGFEGKETETNWMVRERSIAKIRGMLKGNVQEKYLDGFLMGLKGVQDGILKTASSLRTTLATSTLSLITELSDALGHALDPFLDHFLSHTLSMAGQTKKIVAAASQAASKALIVNATYHHRILQLLAIGMAEKTVSARVFISAHVVTFLEVHARHSKHHIEASGGLDILEQVLKKGLADASPAVKENSRTAYWDVNKIWPKLGEKILAGLDPSSRRQLEKADPSKKVAPAAKVARPSTVNVQFPSSFSSPKPAVFTVYAPPSFFPVGFTCSFSAHAPPTCFPFHSGQIDIEGLKALTALSVDRPIPDDDGGDDPSGTKAFWENDEKFRKIFAGLSQLPLSPSANEQKDAALVLFRELVTNQHALFMGSEKEVFALLFQLAEDRSRSTSGAVSSISTVFCEQLDVLHGLTLLRTSLETYLGESTASISAKTRSHALALRLMAKFFEVLPVEELQQELLKSKPLISTALNDDDSWELSKAGVEALAAADSVLQDEERLFAIFDGLSEDQMNLIIDQMNLLSYRINKDRLVD
ncbi:Armadillo-type fold domain containing protein [Pseudohyphozyma bogoriensis]|nr:Armadillo-type fold domain containing protein [Pseudohyphozyma bogoriensis]